LSLPQILDSVFVLITPEVLDGVQSAEVAAIFRKLLQYFDTLDCALPGVMRGLRNRVKAFGAADVIEDVLQNLVSH
jgi:hypothetical protein